MRWNFLKFHSWNGTSDLIECWTLILCNKGSEWLRTKFTMMMIIIRRFDYKNTPQTKLFSDKFGVARVVDWVKWKMTCILFSHVIHTIFGLSMTFFLSFFHLSTVWIPRNVKPCTWRNVSAFFFLQFFKISVCFTLHSISLVFFRSAFYMMCLNSIKNKQRTKFHFEFIDWM